MTAEIATSLLIYLPYLRPTEEEKAVYNEAEEFLAESATILAKLRDYRGATKEIRYLKSTLISCID